MMTPMCISLLIEDFPYFPLRHPFPISHLSILRQFPVLCYNSNVNWLTCARQLDDLDWDIVLVLAT